jgi:predicted DNA-binding transcriptional regulator YafY
MPKKFVTRLKLIDELIQKRNTGNASELAARLQVSERTVKEFIAVMKMLGAPVYYSRKLGSYCYSEKGSVVVRFEPF